MQFDVRRFDIYRKVPKDLTQPTITGAVVSISSVMFIVFLMTNELASFMQTEVVNELFVDVPKTQEKIMVSINVSTPKLPCDFVGLDIQDDMGRHEVGFHENTRKFELSSGGCRFEGVFYINRVPGNFHLSTHSSGRNQPVSPDMTHFVHSLSFGEPLKNSKVGGAFIAMDEVQMLESNALSSHDYILKIVPTVYETVHGVQVKTYQYTFAHKDYMAYGHGGHIMPAIWFRYDLSPLTVKYTERRQPFYHFITTFCAIIGGTFTVAGIIDGLLFTAHEVFRKAELGKLS